MYDIVELKTPGRGEKLILDLQRGFGDDKKTVAALLSINGQLYCLKPDGEEWLLEKPTIKKWPVDAFIKENIGLLKFFVASDLEAELGRNVYVDNILETVYKAINRFFSQEGE